MLTRPLAPMPGSRPRGRIVRLPVVSAAKPAPTPVSPAPAPSSKTPCVSPTSVPLPRPRNRAIRASLVKTTGLFPNGRIAPLHVARVSPPVKCGVANTALASPLPPTNVVLPCPTPRCVVSSKTAWDGLWAVGAHARTVPRPAMLRVARPSMAPVTATRLVLTATLAHHLPQPILVLKRMSLARIPLSLLWAAASVGR